MRSDPGERVEPALVRVLLYRTPAQVTDAVVRALPVPMAGLVVRGRPLGDERPEHELVDVEVLVPSTAREAHRAVAGRSALPILAIEGAELASNESDRASDAHALGLALRLRDATPEGEDAPVVGDGVAGPVGDGPHASGARMRW